MENREEFGEEQKYLKACMQLHFNFINATLYVCFVYFLLCVYDCVSLDFVTWVTYGISLHCMCEDLNNIDIVIC